MDPPKACLLVRPCTHDATGNVTTAERLAAVISSLGYTVTTVAPEEVPQGATDATAWVRALAPVVVVLVHATKSRYLLDDPSILRNAAAPGAAPAPVVLVLGGRCM